MRRSRERFCWFYRFFPRWTLNALNPGDLYLSTTCRAAPSHRNWLEFAEEHESRSAVYAGRIGHCIRGLNVLAGEAMEDDATVFTTAHQLALHNGPVAQNLANTAIQTGVQLDEDGRCSEAIPVFELVLQNYPEDWCVWAGLGIVSLNSRIFRKRKSHSTGRPSSRTTPQ